MSADEIRKWHKARGFKDIGYHYVIHLDGRVENGRNIEAVGTHCEGHNANSIGVVYVGGLSKDGKTPKCVHKHLVAPTFCIVLDLL